MVKTVIVNAENKAERIVDTLKNEGRTGWCEVMLCKYNMKTYFVVWYLTKEA